MVQTNVIRLLKTLVYLSIFLKSFSFFSQAVTLDWAFSIGTASNENANSIASDNSGNVYITGHFENTVDFNPGAGTNNLTAAGARDIYILKLDPNGNFIWAKRIGSTGTDAGTAISIDNNGDVWVTGTFAGTVDFNPNAGTNNLIASGATDLFILKLDNAGNYIWAGNCGGGTQITSTNKIVFDASNNVYIAGRYRATVDFNPNAGTFNLSSIVVNRSSGYVLKLNDNGTFVWAVSYGGAENLTVVGQSLDNASNLIVSGRFRGTVDFDPGAGTNNITATDAGGSINDLYILKLNSLGNFINVQTIGNGIDDMKPHAVETDIANNIYSLGLFTGTVDFNPGAGTFNQTGTSALETIYVLKLNASGNFSWCNTRDVGGSMTGVGGYGDMVVSDGGSVIFSERMGSGTIDFDPGPGTFNLTGINNDGRHGSITIYDTSGNFVDAGLIGTPSKKLDLNASGSIHYATGLGISNAMDFDPTAGTFLVNANQGSINIVIAKFNGCIPPSITIPNSGNLCVGDTLLLQPDSNGTWSSSNPTVAIINDSGVLIGVSTGTTNVTYTNTSTGCSSDPSAGLITVGTISSPTGTGGNTSICGGQYFVFPSRSCGAGTVVWYDNDTAGGTAYTDSVQPTSTTTYYPFCEDGSCSSITGDSAIATVTCFPTVFSGSTWTWTGCTDTNWFNPCNWDRGSIPNTTSLVIIPPTANDPTISSGTANCFDITIQSSLGAVINLNSGSGGVINILKP